MRLYSNNDYQIYYESDPQVMICYKENTFHGLLPYNKHIRTIYQLQDDARDWFEQWIRPKHK